MVGKIAWIYLWPDMLLTSNGSHLPGLWPSVTTVHLTTFFAYCEPWYRSNQRLGQNWSRVPIADNQLLKVTWTWDRNMCPVWTYYPNNSPFFLVSFWSWPKIYDCSGSHILLEFYKKINVLLMKLRATRLHFI